LQLHGEFTFAMATELVGYLSELGVSHCYVSPILRARPQSAHGYDIVDHDSINPEIGTPEELDRFCESLRDHRMGQVLDIVPNHMGVMGADNEWWMDVLENGPASRYASFFDIDWYPQKEGLQGKVLVAVLGDHYGVVLENGQLELRFEHERGTFSVFYYEHRFPVDPTLYGRVLRRNFGSLAEMLGDHSDTLKQFEEVITAFEILPGREGLSKEDRSRRDLGKELCKQQLSSFCESHPRVREFIEENVAQINVDEDDSASAKDLHDLLERQAYRLAYWKTASDEINYRRFFDINDLAGLRQEREEVFDATHKLILDLVGEGKVQGLRVDHPDGLRDPKGYFDRLRERIVDRLGERGGRELYVLAEKILAGHEYLRENWSIDGTTGYDFASRLNGLFVDPAGERRLTSAYSQFIRQRLDFDEVVYESKKKIIDTSLASELNVLADELNRISESHPKTRDFTRSSLLAALEEVVACFPVYRTYVDYEGVDEIDVRYVDWAVAQAKKRRARYETSVFDFIRSVLCDEVEWAEDRKVYREALRSFAMKLQQYTAPVMAKGFEDTALYVYVRLTSLNDVGGEPGRFSTSVKAFHHGNQERARRWPRAMVATTTHDAKRSADVRARINVLSEIPEKWRAVCRRWSRAARGKKLRVQGRAAPSRNDEYLLYQTLVGSFPIGRGDSSSLEEYRERVRGYVLKAAREAKQRTSWINPDGSYERALTELVDKLLTPEDPDANPFLREFLPFVEKVSKVGALNSLSQTLLKLTVPGVPDTYQGCELLRFTLVDPDNRRPVDYDRRRAMLREMRGQSEHVDPAELAASLCRDVLDSRAKLYVTWKTLNLRRKRAELFGVESDYHPLLVSGRHDDRLCCFGRTKGKEGVFVIAPRLMAEMTRLGERLPVGSVWEDTTVWLPEGLWTEKLDTTRDSTIVLRDLYTGRELAARRHDGERGISIRAAEALGSFPLALLETVEA
jgi:(1->4)-alpha-D-glucan 1-alpha-D-glucosylmutase